jgi:D-alanyl-D-alanine carboxypeptidase
VSPYSILQEGRSRRALREAERRRRRRRRRAQRGALLLLAAAVVLLIVLAPGAGGPAGPAGARRAMHRTAPRAPQRITGTGYAERPFQVPIPNPRLRGGLRSGLLFDVHTGAVLWQDDPRRRLPIASLTKMMTALIVAEHSRARDRVLITRTATHFSGSGVGLLPQGRRVPLLTLLYGLLLPSGNDAAIALAEHVAGSERSFVGLMNRRATELGLSCTRFSSVSGILDRGNRSCARDLAVLAHAVLGHPMLARIVATREAVLPFPILGGRLFLFNNNPLLRERYPGANGVKTGYTVAAGRCLVASARRGRRWLAVVLLHSGDPPGQAARLLDLGFAAERQTARR